MQRVVWSTKGRAVIGLLACALTASVLVAQPPEASRRELAREAPSSSETVCEGGTVSMDWDSSDPHTFVSMYIPAGALARFRASGEILPSTYVGNGRGEYVMNVRVWRPDTGTAIWEDWNYAATEINWGPGPYNWNPFGAKTLGEYRNNTGAARNFTVEFWASRSYAGEDLRWDAWADIDDGAGIRSAVCFPIDPSELIDCNPSMKNGCVQVDAADPINTYSGAFHQDFVDIAPIPGRGPTLAAQRFYNTALSAEPGAFGPGWRHNYALSVSGPDANGLMKVTQENGTTAIFRDNGAGGWESPSRSDATLEELPDGGWRFVRRDHQIFEFTPAGVLASIRDLNGYETTLAYSDGLLDTVTDTAGRSLSYTWTGTGVDARITQVSDASTPVRTVTYGYDGSGRLTAVTDVAGGVWRYGYDTNNRIVSVTMPRQEQLAGQPSVLNVYDPAGRVVSQTDEEGQTTLFDYTSEPNATIVTDPEGNKTRYVYDEFSLIASVTKGYQSATPSTWTYTHDLDTFGVTKIVDPNGKLTKAAYDADGDRTSITDPLNRITAWTYNDLDQVLTETDPNGIATTYTYDSAGNPLSVSKPLTGPGGVIDTATTILGYGDSAHPGDMTQVTDPIGRTTNLVYDGTGNLVQTIAPATTAAAGAVTAMSYNEIGWLESVVSPRGNLPGAVAADYTTSYTRNSFGDVLSVTAPDGAATSTVYDANRNVVAVTDANANNTAYSYDLVDRPVAVLRADGTTTETSYTGSGMTASTTDAAANATIFTYDAQDRLVSSTDPLGRATTFAYDPAGNLTTKTAPGPVVTTFGYDAASQLLSIDYPGGTTPDEQFSYDKLGRKATATRRTGTIFQTAWAYDSLGRMTSETATGGDVITYGYDLAGQLTSISHPDNAGTITRTYDAQGQLESVTDWHLRTFSFGYDADGNLVGQRNPNGTSTGIDVDQAGTTTAIAHTGAAGIADAFAQFGYARDDNRQITALTESGVPDGADTYAYDPLNQLTTVSQDTNTAAYHYDAADNITRLLDQTAQHFDAANQLQSSTAPITFVTSTGITDQASKTVVVPYIGSAGDQALLWVTTPADQSVAATPSGFTAVGTWTEGNTTAYLYRRTITSSTDAIATIEFSGLTGAYTKSATAVVYRGVDPDAPIGDVQGATGTGSTVTVPSATADLDNTSHLVFTATHTAGLTTTPGTWTTDAPMTSRATAGPGIGVASTVFDRNMVDAGPTGTVAATNTVPGSLVGVAVALQPDQITYTYDDRGNRTGRTNDAGTTTYTYDAADRLTKVGNNITYGYNADGLRVTKTVDTATTGFVWSTNAALPLLVTENNVHYVYGPGNRLLEAIDPVPAIEYVGGSHLSLTDVPASAVLMPPGVTNRDLILVTTVIPAGQTVDTPDGYTLVEDITAGATRTVIWRRIATDDEPVAIPLTYSLGLYDRAAAIQVWRNIDTDNPIEAVTSTGATATTSITSGTGTATNMWGNQAILIGALNGDTSSTLDSGWTAPTEFQTRPAALNVSSTTDLVIADRAVPNGTVGPYTATNSKTGDLSLTLLVLNHERPPGRYHHLDQLGSIRATTNEYAELTGTATYDPYGRDQLVLSASGDSTNGAPGSTTISIAGASVTLGGNNSTGGGAAADGTSGFGYAGEYTDAETGFTYLRARLYDPETSQFLTRDPVEGVSGDPYGYAFNNPVVLTDPSGLFPGEGLLEAGRNWLFGGDCGEDGFLSGARKLWDSTLGKYVFTCNDTLLSEVADVFSLVPPSPAGFPSSEGTYEEWVRFSGKGALTASRTALVQTAKRLPPFAGQGAVSVFGKASLGLTVTASAYDIARRVACA